MKKIAFIILSSVMMNSCTDMNLIPESNLSPENFFKSEEDATAAVYGTYSVLPIMIFITSFGKYCRVRVLMIASGVVGARRLTWTKML